jgi:hypothetical protein
MSEVEGVSTEYMRALGLGSAITKANVLELQAHHVEIWFRTQQRPDLAIDDAYKETLCYYDHYANTIVNEPYLVSQMHNPPAWLEKPLNRVLAQEPHNVKLMHDITKS